MCAGEPPGDRIAPNSKVGGFADENIYTCLNLPPPADPTSRAGLCVWSAGLLRNIPRRWISIWSARLGKHHVGWLVF